MAALHDWLDTTGYPTAESFQEAERLEDDPLHTNKAWAWQFLRRSMRYRADFDNRTNQELNLFNEKYSLAYPLPYRLKDPEYIPFRNTLGLGEIMASKSGLRDINQRDGKIGIYFDLGLPLKYQMLLAEARLKELQKNYTAPPSLPKRKRITEFIRYLRLIDAKDCGTSNRDISAQFVSEGVYVPKFRSSDVYYQGQQAIERDWLTARNLMSDGYLSLAYTLVL